MEINNYPNYLIYEDGRVFSKKSNIFLKPWTINSGYLCIQLSKENKTKKFLIHRLVASHYCSNPNNYRYVDHRDRNSVNNHKDNLRWISAGDNNQNRGPNINNTSGHRYISFSQGRYYQFSKRINKKSYFKLFKTLKEALCYKYIFLLKIKSGII